MAIFLKAKSQSTQGSIRLSGSKSETNRLLILQALYPNLDIKSASNSDDSKILKTALAQDNSTINIGLAGTAMRFLTAYYAFYAQDKILTGSQRMQQRPIKILVDALNQLGANITYIEKEGFPPIRILGQTPSGDYIKLNANISSQYISALLLIAPKFPRGLKLELTGKILSRPYIEMTLRILQQIGIKTAFNKQTIEVFPKNSIKNQEVTVESDWSSASYFYSLAALSKTTYLSLSTLNKNSRQGDAVVAEIYKQLGVKTSYYKTHIELTKTNNHTLPKNLKLDLSDHPDLAQTIIVTALGLGIKCNLSGLENLKLKETDRLKALKTELQKFKADVKIDESSISLTPPQKLPQNIRIATYQDHRMAMAFAPLCLKTSLQIENPSVVSKSYPDFWKDLKKCVLL